VPPCRSSRSRKHSNSPALFFCRGLALMENRRGTGYAVLMTEEIKTAVALVDALRRARGPVRDVYRANDGDCRISFDGWEVDAAAVDEAVSRGWLVLTYPKKSRDWWRLPEHMPAPRPKGWPRARVRGGSARVGAR
jgi:hypothetical protein